MKTRPVACLECGGPLPPPGRRGPARRTCSERCKKRAQRRRFADVAGFERWVPEGGREEYPSMSADERRRQLVDAVLGIGAGVRPASPEEQVALGVVELRQLVFTIRRAAVDLAPGARAPVETFAIEVGAALKRLEEVVYPGSA